MGARTGDQYLAAMRDERQVWQGGRRIADVTTHPGFAGTAHTLARLYDRQHDPEYRDAMTVEWEGERISLSYLPVTTPEQLKAKRRNIEVWSDATLGQMGRFPDFCAELATGLLDAADWLGEADPRFADNARRYHRHCAERDLCLTHALNDQYYDRSKSVAEQEDPDLILRVVRETEEGPIVRGLRNLATLAPLADECLVYPIRPRAANEEDYALAFAVPMNAPGLTIICRDLYGEHADPDRLPLSARLDEVDATLIFDDVLIPWERVFAYRNPRVVASFHGRLNLWGGYTTTIRLLSRLEAQVGVADLLTRWSGRAKNSTAQTQIGHLLQDVQVLRACIRSAEADAQYSPRGYLAPPVSEAYRLHGIEAADRATRLLQELLTSNLILTGGASDLDDPVVGPFVERYFRGGAPSTRDHLRVLALASDMTQSAFASRQQLYERLQSGEPDAIRMRLAGRLDPNGPAARILRFVQEEWDRTAPDAWGAAESAASS